MNQALLRSTLCRAHARAIESMRFDARTADFVRRSVQGDRITLIAAGKGATAMADGALQVLGDRARAGLVVCPDPGPERPLPARIRVLHAPHPVPDLRSVLAAEACLALAASTPAEDTLLVLISGGASSLLCAPPAGMALAEKMDVVAALLRSGASIREVNTVRRHLSRVKGGRLAQASAATVVCAIASDVVQGECHDVGSGPACADPTSIEQAHEVLVRALGDGRASRLLPWMTEGLSPESADSQRIRAQILVDPQALGAEVASLVREEGIAATTEVVEHCTVEELARRLVELSRTLEPGSAQVITCEPVIRLVEGAGRGGRAGWVALRVALDPALGEDAAVLCGASDGTDGTSGSAGACVSRDVIEGRDREALQRALDACSDAQAHADLGTRIEGGATGLNLCDVYVCARAQPA
ncbi:MAG: glycerate kinase [Deltaproteobacteria bacterium]|nr:glycerate kinase [Deltaproteobacteria bacterium]